MNPESQFSEQVDELAEDFIARWRRGEAPTIDQYVQRHPLLEAQIRDLFPTLMMVERLKPSEDSAARARSEQSVPRGQPWPELSNYRIVRLIARGGMGIVYEAQQRALERRVAIKVLAGPERQHDQLKQRFLNEARSLATLRHPHIVPIYDVGEENGTSYYSMQYIDGQSLNVLQPEIARLLQTPAGSPSTTPNSPSQILARTLVERRSATTRRLPDTDQRAISGQPVPLSGDTEESRVASPVPASSLTSRLLSSGLSGSAAFRNYCRNVADLGIQAAQALDYAHCQGIIHRDIKPGNLLLDLSQTLWVADFGLAKLADHDLTQTGDVLGTLRYMAPERFEGKCDERADIYALGLTLYEMLALRPAFDSNDQLRLLEMIRSVEPRRLRDIHPNIPLDLETIVTKSIHKEPERRYRSAGDLQADLTCFFEGRPIKARQVSTLEKIWSWSRRRPLSASLAATVLLLLVGTTVGSIAAAIKFRDLAQAEGRLLELANREADRAKTLALVAEAEARRAEQAAAENERNLYYAEMKDAVVSSMTQSGFRNVQTIVQRWGPESGRRTQPGWEWYWLYSHTQHAAWTFDETTADHADAIRDVRWSKDGRCLAWSIATDIQIVDIETQRRITLPHPNCDRVLRFCFSPCGQYLASATYGQGLVIWDWAQSTRLGHFLQFPALSAVDWHPDGKRLAVHTFTSEEREKHLVVVDWQSGQVLQTLTGGLRYESGNVQFSPDGRHLAAFVGARSAKIWEWESGQAVAEVEVPGSTTQDIDWHPTRPWVALCALGGAVTLWDFQAGETEQISLDSDGLTAAKWDPNGRYLLVTGRRNIARIWDHEEKREILQLKGHSSWVLSADWNPVHAWVATGSRDQTVKVWKPTEPQALTRLAVRNQPSKARGRCQWIPGSDSFLAGDDHHFRIWRPGVDRFGGYESIFPRPNRLKLEKNRLVSPDGRWLAGSQNNEVIIWDVATNQAVASHVMPINHPHDYLRIRGFFPGTDRLLFTFSRHTDSQPQQVTGYCWEPGVSQPEICFSVRGNVEILDMHPRGDEIWISSGAEIRRLQGGREQSAPDFSLQRYHLRCLKFRDDGQLVALAGDSQVVSVWDTQATNQWVADLEGHTDTVNDLAWNPRFPRLASAAADGSLILWDTESWKMAAQFQLGSGIGQVQWSPDGTMLLAATSTATYIWDARRGYRKFSP
jgi:serine/threonine protein kinase/WD40 repeat protein